MKTKLILFFSQILFLSCSSSKPIQEAVSIEQVGTSYPVVIRGDLDENIIFSVNFPLAFKYENRSSVKRKINLSRFYYCKDCKKTYMRGLGGWGGGIIVYENKNNSLKRINSHFSNNEAIAASQVQEFIAYPSHGIDTTKLTQSELRPYLEQMKKRGATHGKDTLSVGTFKEFKEKHPELTKILLEGDSISFGVLHDPNKPYDEKNDIYITLPIKY